MNAATFPNLWPNGALAFRVIAFEINAEPPNSKSSVIVGIGNSFMNGTYTEAGVAYALTRTSDMAYTKRTPLGGSIVNWRVNVPNPHWMNENQRNTALCCPAICFAYIAPDFIKKEDMKTQRIHAKCYIIVETIIRG